MGVPAHDTRDHTFASHHKLSIFQVIKPVNETEPGTSNSFIQRFLTSHSVKLPFTERGVLFSSGKYDGMTSDQATDAIAADAEKNHFGKAHTNFGLRDWLISRQRYGP
jgi:leucyl-tRNA synthetase